MLLDFEGFDDYTSTANYLLVWPQTPSVFGSSQASLNGVNGLAWLGGNGINQQGQRNLATTYAHLITGFRWKFASLNTNFGTYLFDTVGNGPQIGLSVDSAGTVHVKRGAYNNNADIGTVSGFTAAVGQVYFFEYEVVFATGATGSVTVHINGGASVGGWSQTFSSVQTAQTANANANAWGWSSGSTASQIDDMYICDNTGSTNNTFLGDCRVEARTPAANGRLTQYGTQVGGTGGQPWTAVNEANPDGDTSYIADATAGHEELFTLSSGTTPSTLFGVQSVAFFRKDDAGAHVLASGIGNGTTESFDAGTSCNTTYQVERNTFDTNPFTSTTWAAGDLSTLQVGVKTIS